jgi:hypothetical protein
MLAMKGLFSAPLESFESPSDIIILSTIEACVQNILSIAEDATDLDNTWEPIEITGADFKYCARNFPCWLIFLSEHHRLYRRDILSTTPDGKKSIDDSLIAFATIKGITAGELCFFFFDLKTRWKWEGCWPCI